MKQQFPLVNARYAACVSIVPHVVSGFVVYHAFKLEQQGQQEKESMIRQSSSPNGRNKKFVDGGTLSVVLIGCGMDAL
eukprot:13026284-Ditylum_brightwellii.AAC.1